MQKRVIISNNLAIFNLNSSRILGFKYNENIVVFFYVYLKIVNYEVLKF